MKASAVIQARFNASRLPGKVLFKVMGKTILEYVIERVGRAEKIEGIIVATTTNPEDSKIAGVVKGLAVGLYRGSENDVLDRYYQAAKLNDLKHVVRITADCPLIDPDIIDRVIDRYFESGADYCSNTIMETFPDGEDVEIFRFDALADAWEAAALLSEREHVTPYIRNNPARFKLVNVESETDLSGKRWTLDRKEDFTFIKAVLESLYPEDPAFSMEDVLDFLRKNSSLEYMNKDIVRNEGYLKSLRQDVVFKGPLRKA